MIKSAARDGGGLLRPRWIRFVIASALGASLLSVAVPASADTIGLFSYDTDSVFGPVFSIFNNSNNGLGDDGTFTGLVLNLFEGGAPVMTGIDLTPLTPGASGALGAGQAFDTTSFDLSTAAFDSATLGLVFSGGPLDPAGPVSLTGIGFDPASGTGASHLDAFINFTPGTAPGPVPEPSTLVLIGAGGLLAALRRRKSPGASKHG
jgi:hypothetical protein